MKVVFSTAAKDDLLDIAVYISQDNPKRALSFVDEMESKCSGLVGHAPGIGTARPEPGQDIRMLTHGRHLIFYREKDAMIRIGCILHGARDIGSDDFDVDG